MAAVAPAIPAPIGPPAAKPAAAAEPTAVAIPTAGDAIHFPFRRARKITIATITTAQKLKQRVQNLPVIIARLATDRGFDPATDGLVGTFPTPEELPPEGILNDP